MYKLIIVFLSAVSLSGCFSAIMDAATVVGSGINSAVALLPAKPPSTVVFDHDKIKELCIEWNRSVALSDFVPTLQSELKRHDVSSRVYDAGSQPTSCPITLEYNAFLKWDIKTFSTIYTPYMTFASITLRKEGRVIGTAQYRIGAMGQDKWSSTSSKISPMIEALLAKPDATAPNKDQKNQATFNGS